MDPYYWKASRAHPIGKSIAVPKGRVGVEVDYCQKVALILMTY